MQINRVRVLQEVSNKINRMEDKVSGRLRLTLIKINDRLLRSAKIAEDMNTGSSLVDIDLKQSVLDSVKDLALGIKLCKKDKKMITSLKWWQKELNSFIDGNHKIWTRNDSKAYRY